MELNLYSGPLAPVDETWIQRARAFAREQVAPIAESCEKEQRQPALIRQAIRTFTKLYIPQALGGLGASTSTICRELEELAQVDYGFTFAFEVHNHMTIVTSTTQNAALRDRYLPQLMQGEKIGAFLLTEPGAGSDAGSIQSSVVKDGESYLLNGEKAWVTNAGTADLLLVFARIAEGTRGIMGFIVDRTWPGVELVEKYDMIGAHAMETGAFRFTNVKIPADHVAFGEGEGFKTALGAIDFARFAVAAMCNGAYIGAMETAIAYAKEREQFGKPILKNQALQFKLAEELTQLEASRLLAFRAAQAIDAGEPATVIASHAKKYAVQASYNGVSVCMQCMGSNGLKRAYPLVRQLTGLAISFNTDGTNDICNLVIGRAL
jgi:alkylation response protein AidB-like acyl-CoA dehydrogenase